MIQVGLVGVGAEWKRYRPALSRLRRPIHIEAVYDPVFARAEQAAKELDADPVEGLQALASLRNVEAILVMDPGWTRTSIVPLLARYRKPLFLAPWVLNGGTTLERLSETRATSESPIVPAMWRRFLPAAIRLQELIATELGGLREITVDLTTPAELTSAEPHSASGDDENSSHSGVTLESLVGWLDFCRNLFRAFPLSASWSRPATTADRPNDDRDIFELNVEYRQRTGHSSVPAGESPLTDNPASRESQTGRRACLRIAIDKARSISDSPSTLILHTPQSGVIEPASTLPSQDCTAHRDAFPQITFHCEKGKATITSPVQIQWQTGSSTQKQETLTSERSEEEIMLDIFCRRVIGGLVPVADLDDILRPIQLLESCREC